MIFHQISFLSKLSLAAALAAIVSFPAGAATRITAVKIKEHVVKLEVVSTPEAMRQGLMFRDKLDPGTGMLFVYPKSQPLTFWMKNTRLPLSIAFIDAGGIIGNIEDMAPFDERTIHRSARDALYALEVNLGWFAANSIVAGDKVHFLKTVDSENGSAVTTRPGSP